MHRTGGPNRPAKHHTLGLAIATARQMHIDQSTLGGSNMLELSNKRDFLISEIGEN
jgi:hypothetical protein